MSYGGGLCDPRPGRPPSSLFPLFPPRHPLASSATCSGGGGMGRGRRRRRRIAVTPGPGAFRIEVGEVGVLRRGAATSTGITATASRRAEALATVMPGCLRETARWRAGAMVGVGAGWRGGRRPSPVRRPARARRTLFPCAASPSRRLALTSRRSQARTSARRSRWRRTGAERLTGRSTFSEPLIRPRAGALWTARETRDRRVRAASCPA